MTEGLQRERFTRLAFDFDGSVQCTKEYVEGTAVAVDVNKTKKEPEAIVPCFLRWPKPVNSLMFSILPGTSMIPMAQPAHWQKGFWSLPPPFLSECSGGLCCVIYQHIFRIIQHYKEVFHRYHLFSFLQPYPKISWRRRQDISFFS